MIVTIRKRSLVRSWQFVADFMVKYLLYCHNYMSGLIRKAQVLDCKQTILSEVYKLITAHSEMLLPFIKGRKWSQLRVLEF